MARDIGGIADCTRVHPINSSAFSAPMSCSMENSRAVSDVMMIEIVLGGICGGAALGGTQSSDHPTRGILGRIRGGRALICGNAVIPWATAWNTVTCLEALLLLNFLTIMRLCSSKRRNSLPNPFSLMPDSAQKNSAVLFTKF